MKSFQCVGEDMKMNLEAQLKNIELQDKESQKIIEREQTGEEHKQDESDTGVVPPKVDTY
jgi:hypothetical protein